MAALERKVLRKDAERDPAESLSMAMSPGLQELLYLFVLQTIATSDTRTISRPTALKRLQAMGSEHPNALALQQLVAFANRKRVKHTPPTTEFTLAFYFLEEEGALACLKSSYALSTQGEARYAELMSGGDFLTRAGLSRSPVSALARGDAGTPVAGRIASELPTVSFLTSDLTLRAAEGAMAAAATAAAGTAFDSLASASVGAFADLGVGVGVGAGAAAGGAVAGSAAAGSTAAGSTAAGSAAARSRKRSAKGGALAAARGIGREVPAVSASASDSRRSRSRSRSRESDVDAALTLPATSERERDRVATVAAAAAGAARSRSRRRLDIAPSELAALAVGKQTPGAVGAHSLGSASESRTPVTATHLARAPASGAPDGGAGMPRHWLLRGENSGYGSGAGGSTGSASPSSFRSYVGCHNLPLNVVTTAKDEHECGSDGSSSPQSQAAEATATHRAHDDEPHASSRKRRRASLDDAEALQLYRESVPNGIWADQQREAEQQMRVREDLAREHRLRVVFDAPGSPAPTDRHSPHPTRGYSPHARAYSPLPSAHRLAGVTSRHASIVGSPLSRTVVLSAAHAASATTFTQPTQPSTVVASAAYDTHARTLVADSRQLFETLPMAP